MPDHTTDLMYSVKFKVLKWHHKLSARLPVKWPTPVDWLDFYVSTTQSLPDEAFSALTVERQRHGSRLRMSINASRRCLKDVTH